MTDPVAGFTPDSARASNRYRSLAGAVDATLAYLAERDARWEIEAIERYSHWLTLGDDFNGAELSDIAARRIMDRPAVVWGVTVMSKTHYSATFSLPDGSEFKLTRGSRQDYGYTWAWLLIEGDKAAARAAGAVGVDAIPYRVVAKGFYRDRRLAESAVRASLRDDRIALFAPVTKGGAR